MRKSSQFLRFLLGILNSSFLVVHAPVRLSGGIVKRKESKVKRALSFHQPTPNPWDYFGIPAVRYAHPLGLVLSLALTLARSPCA